MDKLTLSELEKFPDMLEKYFYAIPDSHRNWSPDSWEGIPSEEFNAVEQICHVRDIEIDGYHQRFKMMLEQDYPSLESVDGYTLVTERNYANAKPDQVFKTFREARDKTLNLIENLSDDQMKRNGFFEGYGDLTVEGLIHYLCSHDQQHLSGLQWLLGKIKSDS